MTQMRRLADLDLRAFFIVLSGLFIWSFILMLTHESAMAEEVGGTAMLMLLPALYLSHRLHRSEPES
ncbi:MAG: hypothetical protein E7A72_10510 [Actinomyces urogenitalis]|uniref:Uncharacterized protein n=3 Tax=Actinomyces urogenitalis TaxID=103621 RepID=C0W8V3_9ACTO|nr:hypothetical protein [Actinomyces urogenitalis]ETJ07274.1 MAG: hypothetical protein Q605_AUC00090G0003 [Actinomyces urogenitalis DORA_12]EEH64842.1 hypothetical protein HMPREF0058_2297 [Actinomyces urogenitalis DSM 15434]MBS5977010.1 hypothetical protein [Actinomyces urogenitalis]MDK8836014.1 hypothetical protein [Actinomyces urogenitalis]MDU0973302.1 hypothetical protein [Actinomyces urogenitalis]